jgi:hypothetical protein
VARSGHAGLAASASFGVTDVVDLHLGKRMGVMLVSGIEAHADLVAVARLHQVRVGLVAQHAAGMLL